MSQLNKDVSRDKLKLYQNCRKAVAETAVDNAYQVERMLIVHCSDIPTLVLLTELFHKS